MLILRIQHTLGLCNGNNLRGGDDVGGQRHPAGAGQGRQADVLRQVRVCEKIREKAFTFSVQVSQWAEGAPGIGKGGGG